MTPAAFRAVARDDWLSEPARRCLLAWVTMATPADAPVWAGALADPSPAVRAAAVAAINNREGVTSPVAAAALLLAAADPDPAVRLKAANLARGVIRFQPPPTAAAPPPFPLTAAMIRLTSDPDPCVREAAVRAVVSTPRPTPGCDDRDGRQTGLA